MKNLNFEEVMEKQIALLCQKDGDMIPAGKLPELLRSVLAALEHSGDTKIDLMRNQVSEMQQFITNARREIAGIRPNAMREVDIPVATDELDAVVAATEAATNAILDSVEKLESVCTGLSSENAAQLETLVVKIYEASNFQDITGQRIGKVVSTLKGIEARVSKLAAVFPDLEEDAAEQKEGEASLLNGPQMPSNANAQDDIDAMFN